MFQQPKITKLLSLTREQHYKEIPVLIVGGGPTGLVTSLLLSRYGVPSLLVERHAGTSIYPRATGLSTRTMELLRQWGLEQRVRELAVPVDRSTMLIVPSMMGPAFAEVSMGYPAVETALADSPALPAVCPQDALEPLLLEYARSYEEAQIMFNTELTTFTQDAAGVTATIVDRVTGEQTLVRARYVVAADGARSRVRAQVGIAMEGDESLGDHLSMHFRADLKRHIPHALHPLYIIKHPVASGVMLPTDADDRWLFSLDWHPEQDSIDNYPVERCVELIRLVTGIPGLTVEMLGKQPFAFTALVAQRYRAGKVFLAGDAAHRMTPSGGMGMNTAIHDAHNLAWKLAAVLNGWAAPALLDSYEVERRPVGLFNTLRSAGKEDRTLQPSDLARDMGYYYRSSAVVTEEHAATFANSQITFSTGFTGEPGTRAPHLWLRYAGQRLSTLDLYDDAFTLLVDSTDTVWQEVARHLAATSGVPLHVYTIGAEGEFQSELPDWHQLYGISQQGAVLVRPDGFIAWRHLEAVSDPYLELSLALDQITGHGAQVHVYWEMPGVVQIEDMSSVA